MAKKLKASSAIFLLILFTVGGTSFAQRPGTLERPHLKWLLNQQVPNEVVPYPINGRSGLVLSYSIPQAVPTRAGFFDLAYIYDNALAAIAFTLSGKFDEAKNILSALAGLVDTEGKLGVSYNTMSSGFDLTFRTGPIAWVGYAFVFYMRAASDDQFQGTATKIADWVLTMQDGVNGSVKGGLNAEWFSTEDNIAAFFFFRDIGLYTRNQTYLQAAGKIRRSLLTNHWNNDYRCFQAGIGNDAKLLHAASWGALFALSIEQPQRALACLRFIERNFKAEVTRKIRDKEMKILGYKPKAGEEVNFVWSEGSLGVALAHKRVKNWEKFLQIVLNMEKMRGPKGGILYAFPAVQNFPAWESVAGTAWIIIFNAKHQWAFWSGPLKRQQQLEATSGVESINRDVTSSSRTEKSGKTR